MRARVEKSLCIACGMCIQACPHVFCLGEEGLAEAAEKLPPESYEDVIQTAEDCPVGAIRIAR